MLTSRGFGVMAVLGAVGVVGGLGLGGFAVKKMSDRIDELTQAMDQRAGEAIRAIPGERLLQMYDKLFSADPKQQAEVKDVLKRMIGTDITKEYEASVTFTFDVTKHPLEGQIFAAQSESIDEVRELCKPNRGCDPRPVKGNTLRGLSREEFYAALGKGFFQASQPTISVDEVEAIAGRKFTGVEKTFVVPSAVSIEFTGKPAPYYGSSQDAAPLVGFVHQARLNRWANAAMLLTDNPPSLVAGGLPTIPWRPALGSRFLFVVLRSEQLDQHKDDTQCRQHVSGSTSEDRRGCVTVWVHESGHPDQYLYGTQPYSFDVLEFYGNPPIPDPVEPATRQLRWAAHLMDNSGLDSKTFESIWARQGVLTKAEEHKAVAQ